MNVGQQLVEYFQMDITFATQAYTQALFRDCSTYKIELLNRACILDWRNTIAVVLLSIY